MRQQISPNPTDGSRWMVKVQPTLEATFFFESHRRQSVDG